jgi:transposase-like protein
MAATGKRFKAEQIVNLLREIDVLTANGKSLLEACKQIGVSDKSYYRWRKIYGGLKVDQARKFKEVEAENARLKKLVAELSLREAMLKEVVRGNY